MQTILTLTMNPSVDKSTCADNVTPERKLRCESPRYEPGGGGINVSRAIHRLGGESVAVYPAGGPSGQMLRGLLDQEGLGHHPIQIKGWTREDFIVREESTNQQFRFSMPGPVLQDEEWNICLSEVPRIDPKPYYIVASGSLPPGVPKDLYARVARLARDLGARMILDTSGEALSLALREGVFLIKPNLGELKEIAEHEIEDELQQEDLARQIVSSGQSKVVVISLGAAGALAVTEEGCERLRAPTVAIKSRVGAGDSMVAGIVLSLSRGLSLKDAVVFGVAAGAAAVMTPGTELCRLEDTEKLYKHMTSATTP